MKRHLLILGASVIAGLATGTLSKGWRGSPSAAHDSAKAVQSPHSARLNSPADPRETALGAALGELLQAKSSLRGLADLASALEQLDSSRVATLLDRLERAQHAWPASSDDRIAWIFKWWLKRDAKAADSWAQPRLAAFAQEGPLGMNLEGSSRAQMIAAWAEANPGAALEFARSHAHTGAANLLLKKVLAARWDRPVQERLALLLDFPASHARDVALVDFHRSWASRNPAEACASVQSLPSGPLREKATSEVLLNWADKDAPKAFAQYRALGLSDSVLLSKLLAKRAAKNPADAIEWLQQLDAAQIARGAPRIVKAWVERDASAALAWALENGVRLSMTSQPFFEVRHDGFQRSSSMGSEDIAPLATALTKQPEATLKWLQNLPTGAERDRLLEIAVTGAKAHEQAVTLFSMLAAEAQTRAATRVAGRFYNDARRGCEWAASLPVGPARVRAWEGIGKLLGADAEPQAGPDRDAYLIGSLRRPDFVQAPGEKLAIVYRIDDPVRRHDAFDEVMERYSRFENSAKETRSELETAPVPEEWKKKWRALMDTDR